MNNYYFYKVNEVSKILKVNPVTVRRWCKSGTIKAKKLGKSWYINGDELNLLKDTGRDQVSVEKNN